MDITRCLSLLVVMVGLVGGSDSGTGAAVCNCVGTSCNVYAKWDYKDWQSCKDAVLDETSIVTDSDAWEMRLLKNETVCRGVDRGSDMWVIVDNTSCGANKSSPNHNDWVDEVFFKVYNAADCQDSSLQYSIRVPVANGLCQTAIKGPGHSNSEEKWTVRFILIVVLTPFVTALIGYGTNVIAIKMIFRPYNPVCGYSCTWCGMSSKHPGQPRCYWRGIQGVFPKRQYSLALQIGDMVEKNLISAEEMVAKMKKEMGLDDTADPTKPSAIDEELSNGVKQAVGTMLDKRSDTPGFGMFLMAMGGKETFRDNLARGTVSAFKANLPYLMETFASSFTNFIPFKEIITERIRHQMTPADLEDMFMSFMATELGFVEQLGGYLGFMVGILQGCIFIVAGT